MQGTCAPFSATAPLARAKKVAHVAVALKFGCVFRRVYRYVFGFRPDSFFAYSSTWKKETRDRRQETKGQSQEIRDTRREAGDNRYRQETGDMRKETRDRYL